MNKKAFTLIELMGVVIILSLLVLISIPVVDKYIKKSKVAANESQCETIIMAAKNWASDNKDELPDNGGAINVSFDSLMELGYLDMDTNIYSFKCNDKALYNYDSIEIKNNGKQYAYEFSTNNSTDSTGPINLSMKLVNSTVQTLTVKASATDAESTIVKYEFNIDGTKDNNGNLSWEGNNGSRVYTFKNIGSGEHKVMFRVTNSAGLSTISKEYTYDTEEVSEITFTLKNNPSNCTSARTIRIIYPAGSTDRKYATTISLDDSSFKSVSTNTVDVKTEYDGQPITVKAIVDDVDVITTYNVRYYITKTDGSTEYCK